MTLWRSPHLFNIDFAEYRLSHHHFSRHFHGHYVIELVTAGADSFYCNGKNHIATQGEMVCINPGEVHTGNTVDDHCLQYYSICPTRSVLFTIADYLQIDLPHDFNFDTAVANRPVLADLISKLFHSFQQNENNDLQQEQLFAACMRELLCQEGKHYIESTNSPKDARIKKMTDYINANFKNNISLSGLAEMVNLDPCHLIRLFKKATGLSPYDYLLVTRIEYGKKLLQTGCTVNEAATVSGFYDTSHFNRIFRKFAGMSPKYFLSSKSQFRTNFTA